MVIWIVAAAAVQSVLMLLLAACMPGIAPGHLVGAMGAVIALALGWYPLYRVAARSHPALFPPLLLLLSGAAVRIGLRATDAALPDMIQAAVLLAVGGVLHGAAFALRDPAAYDWFVVRHLARRFRAGRNVDAPGILFVEIDGLAEPILRRAVEQGYMPTLARWLDRGSHRLCRWETDLSSQTSASQAGILLGDNADIPAFRWYDKPRHRLMDSSEIVTARELERAHATGDGLLAGGGAARWSLFSGEADDCLGVYSRLSLRLGGGHAAYYAFFSNPYALTRMLVLFVAEVARERYQALRQSRRSGRPRVRRTFRYALTRAGCSALLQEATGVTLIADMHRCLPAVYATLFAYDEIAHYAGIASPESLDALARLDRLVATLERAAGQATRPYRFVVLSDHGQSEGTPFRQRYGVTLAALVRQLIADGDDTGRPPSAEPDASEGERHIRAALAEIGAHNARTRRHVGHLLHNRSDANGADGHLGVPVGGLCAETEALREEPVVTVSGNLGLISFPHWSTRMTCEEIAGAFPRLLAGLVGHPGIACVLVHSAEGGVVLGARGVRFLGDGRIEGDDPLATLGPNAAAHLARADGFANAADIAVLSRFDPATGEVAAFEELIGSHGGLGGMQTVPFILYPTDLPFDAARPIVGAAALHDQMRPWVERALGARPEIITTQSGMRR